jgi:ABC-type phosphate transport system permease subunit
MAGKLTGGKNSNIYQFTGDMTSKRQNMASYTIPTSHSIFNLHFAAVITLLVQETNKSISNTWTHQALTNVQLPPVTEAETFCFLKLIVNGTYLRT